VIRVTASDPTLAGKEIEIEYTGSKMTVLKLKSRVHESEGVPVEQMLIVTVGRQREDERTLAAYGFGSGSIGHNIYNFGGC
jgi:hypothetical protein